MAREAESKRAPVIAPPEFDDYWQLRMEGATSRLKAAQQIVSHPGTRGSLAENLLRELIREFLPQRWAVGTGFIMDADRRRSNQVDVLIYDQLTMSPVFRDGELVVLSPKAVRVAIEVKSQLNGEEIPKAYTNICSVRRIDPDVRGFVFGYDGVSAETFGEHVRSWAATGAPGREYWPDQVFNMKQSFLILPPDSTIDRAAADRAFTIAAGKDPIVRMFLTATLQSIGSENLRNFFRQDETGDELLKL